jgi:hypothetical protein
VVCFRNISVNFLHKECGGGGGGGGGGGDDYDDDDDDRKYI